MNDELGTFGASVGSGQHRFWFVPREQVDRITLFDRVAGLLLREVGSEYFVSALYLYPPDAVESDGAPAHAFMLLLEARGENEPELAQSDGKRQRRTTDDLRAQVVALHDRGVVLAGIADTLNTSDSRVRKLLAQAA